MARQPAQHNQTPPEVVTALRALTIAVYRLTSVVENFPIPSCAEDDTELAEILKDAGKQALQAAYNALEMLEGHGLSPGLDDNGEPDSDRPFLVAFKKAMALGDKKEAA